MGTNEFVPASLALLGFIEAVLDHVDDFREFLREVLAELRIVVFLNVSEFLLPAFHVNLRDFRESFLIVVSEAFSIDGAVLRHVTDRSFLSIVNTVAAVEDPCEHAAVVAVTRPHEATRELFVVGILAEPVHVEDPRKLVYKDQYGRGDTLDITTKFE